MDFRESKLCLMFVTGISWAAGVGLTYASAYIINSYKTLDDFGVGTYGLVPAAIIFGAAMVMFVFSVIGCCASMRSAEISIGIFLLIIMLTFAAETAVVVFSIIYKCEMSLNLQKSMKDVFIKYNGFNSESKAVDFLQSQLECCGVRNYTDWESFLWFAFQNNTVPISCCKENTTCTGQFNQPELLNTIGCEVKQQKLLQNVLGHALLVFFLFAIIRYIGIFSIYLITYFKSINY